MTNPMDICPICKGLKFERAKVCNYCRHGYSFGTCVICGGITRSKYKKRVTCSRKCSKEYLKIRHKYAHSNRKI